jgi:hypothetical protein
MWRECAKQYYENKGKNSKTTKEDDIKAIRKLYDAKKKGGKSCKCRCPCKCSK